MFTLNHRPRPGAALLGLAAAGLLSFAPPAARAQDGTPGTPGTPGLVLPGSFTFNNPSATFQGTSGTNGGPGADPGFGMSMGGTGGAGGGGGAGVVATGINASITILSGTFAGGGGGIGGLGGRNAIGSPRDGSSGGGGSAFSATGTGTNITILGGTFNGGLGGSTQGPNDIGGPAGNDFSTGPGETASIYGGNFAYLPFGGGGVGRFGMNGFAFALNGSSVTVYGTFLTQPGGTPIVTPKTFTSGVGSFFGLLANNTGPGQSYIYTVANGGTLTLAPSPVPEASTTVSFGLLLALGLGGLMAAKRKKVAP